MHIIVLSKWQISYRNSCTTRKLQKPTFNLHNYHINSRMFMAAAVVLQVHHKLWQLLSGQCSILVHYWKTVGQFDTLVLCKLSEAQLCNSLVLSSLAAALAPYMSGILLYHSNWEKSRDDENKSSQQQNLILSESTMYGRASPVLWRIIVQILVYEVV